MEVIFHEKQEGSLCAQHCLNALLQGSYFTPVDLATLAQQMDNEERLRMAESGIDTEDYRRFIEQPSGNYDDSGYFSVQVISSALEVWGLEIVPYSSSEPRALQAQKDPCQMSAFICNYRDHWFTIRKLGNQWFNLNSLLTGPELISNTYLSMFLAQLQQEGFSIFVVFGILPESEADNLLKITPAVQVNKPKRINSTGGKNENPQMDEDMKKAISASLNDFGDDDEQLQKALEMSLDNDTVKETKQTKSEIKILTRTTSEEEDEINLQKALRLSLQTEDDLEAQDEDSELEKAVRMSLECCDSPPIDQEELRRQRLSYLERINNTPCSSTSKNSLNT